MDLRNNLIKQFGIELPATVIFDYPSTEALGQFVTVELPHQPDAEVLESSETRISRPSTGQVLRAPQVDPTDIR